MSGILQSSSGSTSSEDGSSHSEGSDHTVMTRTVDLLLASLAEVGKYISDE